jgi:hypothetical protein
MHPVRRARGAKVRSELRDREPSASRQHAHEDPEMLDAGMIFSMPIEAM